MTRTPKTAPGADAVAVPGLAGVATPLGGGNTVAEKSTLPLPVGAFMTDDHRYYFNGEGPLPSVTTLLGLMDKPAIVQWKAREVARAIYRDSKGFFGEQWDKGEEEAISWAVRESDKARDTAARLGSSVHLLADMALRGPESQSEGFQVSEREKPYLDAFRGFVDRYSASAIVSSEKAVWSLNGYAGTYDLLMQLPCSLHWEGVAGNESLVDCPDPELWLIDIKTSKGYYPEYGLQLAAYRWADSIILPGDPKPYPMPEVHRTGVLHLRPDTYPDTGWRLIEYPTDYQRDYLPFLGLVELWKWKSEGRFSKKNLNTV